MGPVLIDFFEPRSRKDTKEHEDLCVLGVLVVQN